MPSKKVDVTWQIKERRTEFMSLLATKQTQVKIADTFGYPSLSMITTFLNLSKEEDSLHRTLDKLFPSFVHSRFLRKISYLPAAAIDFSGIFGSDTPAAAQSGLSQRAASKKLLATFGNKKLPVLLTNHVLPIKYS